MPAKVILLDLDDTIISYDGVSLQSWRETCDNFAQNTNLPFDADMLFETIKNTRRWYWSDPERHRIGRMDLTAARREIVKLAFAALRFASDAQAAAIADAYCRRQEEYTHLFPGSLRTLEALRSKGMRLALVTNGSSEKQRGKINRFGLLQYFEHCFIEEEVGFGKPDIRIFEFALKKMGVQADDTWMVGDNLVWDVEAPQKLGIFSIWNDCKNKGLPENCPIKPDRIVHTIAELI